jgi:hypothetical protein
MGRQVQAASTTARQPQAASRASGGDAILARHRTMSSIAVNSVKSSMSSDSSDSLAIVGLAKRSRDMVRTAEDIAARLLT